MLKDIDLFEKETIKFKDDKHKLLSSYNLNIGDIVNIEINRQPLLDIVNNKNEALLALKNELRFEENVVPEDENGNIVWTYNEVKYQTEKELLKNLPLQLKKSFIKSEIEVLKTKLSKPALEYQAYLERVSEWNKREQEIVGTAETSDTLSYYQGVIEYLNCKLASELQELRKQRLDKSLAIYRKKKEIKDFFDNIKKAIDEKLAKYQELLKDYKIRIQSSLSIDNNFVSDLLWYINKTVAGSFRGIEDGQNMFENQILKGRDINKEKDIELILSDIIEFLEEDKRPNQAQSRYIGSQVQDRNSFYNYLFSMDYIQPYYDLIHGDKPLEQLSPGEKGALLLVFYLLLDISDIPLIIDQPEDNLDNQSITKILVPFIKEAKKHRQIIIVTHNPNLAVVADAEQVINVCLDKGNNKFSFCSGGIENMSINDKIIAVLEGTKPAFKKRKNKYYFNFNG